MCFLSKVFTCISNASTRVRFSTVDIKINGVLLVPSVSVLRIVKQCEIVLQSSVNVKRVLPGQWKRVLVLRMLADMPTDIYCNLF